MNEVDKALAIIEKYGPKIAEAGAIVSSVAAAVEVLKNLMSEEAIDPAVVARVDAAYQLAYSDLIATE